MRRLVLIALLLTGCATITPDPRPVTQRHELLNIRVATRTSFSREVGIRAAGDEDVFRSLLEQCGPFQEVNDSSAGRPLGDLHAALRVLTQEYRSDPHELLKVYATAFSFMLLSPFIRYHESLVVAGALDLASSDGRVIKTYAETGRARLDRAVLDFRWTPVEAAARAALESLSARLISGLWRDYEKWRRVAKGA